MTRPLQKKKNKSSLPRVRQKPKSKAVNIKSNPIVAAHWDQSLTLRQNYRRLGLSSRLNASTGGVEKKQQQQQQYKATTEPHDDLLLSRRSSLRKATQLKPARVRVMRNEKGAITGVIRDEEEEEQRQRKNPLNDPLNGLTSDDDDEEGGADAFNRDGRVAAAGVPARSRAAAAAAGIVPELEESAKYGKRKRPRKQSQREREWVERLVARHGEDYGAMRRDRKLNPMQQSEGDLRRRIAVWQKEKAKGGGDEVMEEG